MLKLSEATKRTYNNQQERVSGILNNEKRHCNISMMGKSAVQCHVQANQNNTQMQQLSLECNSTCHSTPVFNISNCSTVSISFTK